MNYKVGDIVQINSIDWYNKNKNNEGYIQCVLMFVPAMKKYCGMKAKISHIDNNITIHYRLEIDGTPILWNWTDSMLENIKKIRKEKLKKIYENN